MDVLGQLDLLSLVVHLAGAAVLAGVFWFLHRESGIVYFGYWALAWGLLSAALAANLASLMTGRKVFLAPYALLELAFCASLVFAGASVFGKFDIRFSLPLLLLPAAALIAFAFGFPSDLKGFYALLSLLLTGAYGWNFFAFRSRWQSGRGTGHKLFSATLLASSLFYFHYSLLYASLHMSPEAPTPAYLRYHELYNLMLETVLAFSAMMMWMEAQQEELVQANRELARSRSEIARSARLDPLTGLLNRAAFNETCETNEPVTGVVAIIDLDNFKQVNDALGHLAGDEVLAHVGRLIKSSVRKEDQAWRWGGDEFVLLFPDQSRTGIEPRLLSLAERLLDFRVRGKGELPVRASWGAAEVVNGSLEQALEEADREMYNKKRAKVAGAAGAG
jgi:diguanylate cyclase (GGDEF)-like protein